ASVGAWAAAFAYAANPNLIYMQATAMTESVYLALFIWAVVYFAEFLRALKVRALKENNRRKNDDANGGESSPVGRESSPDGRESSPGGANQLSPALQRGVGREKLSKSRRACPERSRRDPGLAHTLTRCAWCLAGAELTRYDGWFLAGVMGTAVAVIALRSWQNRTLRRVAAKFLLGIAVVPVLWLV